MQNLRTDIGQARNQGREGGLGVQFSSPQPQNFSLPPITFPLTAYIFKRREKGL